MAENQQAKTQAKQHTERALVRLEQQVCTGWLC
eukprot:COSAG01_NODE_5561_length_4184_cov_13.309670_1_plen_32_part_10